MQVVPSPIKVTDLMSQDLVTTPLDTPLIEVARLLDRKRSRYVLVIDEQSKLLGLVSDSSVVRYIAGHDSLSDFGCNAETVACVMAKKFLTSSPDASIEDVAAAFTDGAVQCVPVLEHDRVVGVVTERDLLLSGTWPDQVVDHGSMDVLTGLANRTQFHQRLDEELDRAARQRVDTALILFDVDRFKNVNDCWGHDTGDSVLRIVASCLRRHLRKYDVVARIGGDEFAAICTATGLSKVATPIHRLRSAVRSLTVATQTGHQDISLSIGAALLESNQRLSASQFVATAQQCLRRAMADGGDKAYVMQIAEESDSEPRLLDSHELSCCADELVTT